MAVDYNCIDICYYSDSLTSKVNFKTMKENGVEYAIFRSIRKRLITDQAFESYYKRAVAAGLKVGVYLYSYAQNTSYAKKEANTLVKLLNKRKLHLPVFYDLEDRSIAKKIGKGAISDIALAFKKIIENAGYEFGIYCDADYYKEFIIPSKFPKVPFWIAKYSNPKPTGIANMVGWQYKGNVSGVGIPNNMKCDHTHWYGLANSNETENSIKYHVRKSWDDKKSQEGAFIDLDNAKKCADDTGCIVFNTSGELIYPQNKSSYTEKSCNIWGQIINCVALNIRKEPDADSKILGTYSKGDIVHLTKIAYENGENSGRAKTNLGWIKYSTYFEKAIGEITIICNSLKLRSSTNNSSKNNIKGYAKNGETYIVINSVKSGSGIIWYRLSSGLYCSSNKDYVKFTKY